MQTINLEKIIEESSLTKKEVAQQLFPGNKYPTLALNRIITGETVLDANQISKLSMLSGISIDQLFGSWKITSHDRIHVFTNKKYRAELDGITWRFKVFHNKSLFHEEIIFPPGITVNDLLSLLNALIQDYETH